MSTLTEFDNWAQYGSDGPPKDVVEETLTRVYDEWRDHFLKQPRIQSPDVDYEGIVDESKGVRHFVIRDGATGISCSIYTVSPMKAFISAMMNNFGEKYDKNAGWADRGSYGILSGMVHLMVCQYSVTGWEYSIELGSIFESGRLTKAAVSD